MVRPVNSKRKLFNTSKEQSKENEPAIDQLKSENFALRQGPLSQCVYQVYKPLNLSGRGGVHLTDESKEGSFITGSRRCDFEDARPTLFTPGRTAMPMSERQQIALLMQMASSPSPPNQTELTLPSQCTTPQFSRGINKRNERGETPLHLAAIKGDGEKVAQLVTQGVDVNATDYAGWTALHEACNKGFIIIAYILIRAGADVNAKGLENDTPLHDACVNNHHKIARLLLKSGAKTDALNQRGKSARDVCRSPRILSLIEQSDAGVLEDLNTTEFETSFSFIPEIPLANPFYSQYQLSEMSRRTPPNSKMEEKTSAIIPGPICTSKTSAIIPVPICTSAQSNPLMTSNSGNNNGNGRPSSPRVTMRMTGPQKTPDKSKSAGETEDVYEFRCSKEEGSEGDAKEEKSSPDVVVSSSTNEKRTRGEVVSSSTNEKRTRGEAENEKRTRGEAELDDDEESKKKRRKEENIKCGIRGAISSRPPIQEKIPKIGSRSNSGNGSGIATTGSSSGSSAIITCTTSSTGASCISSCTSTTASSDPEKKSPSSSCLSAANSPEPRDSDNDDLKNETGAPKVPPLKIVLAPCGLSEQEISCQNGKNGNNRQLPYVVNSAEGKDQAGAEGKEISGKDDPSSPSTSVITSATNSMSSTSTISNLSTITTSASSSSCVLPVTSSSSGNAISLMGPNGSSGILVTSTTAGSSSDKSAPRITRSQRGGTGSDEAAPPEKVKMEVKQEDPPLPSFAPEVIHPRKRKIRPKEPETELSCTSTTVEPPMTNCYEMFLKIRKQVDRRRKLLFPVQPKPPQGFKDYLMNRCSYVLANSNNSQLSIPIVSAPASLPQPISGLFNEQERERHKLKVQQMIEKEKLVLSVEQEILRVHGRAARALANQVLPFSVCTILKDEEVYNVISAEQEEKDRNARSRYNGRLFLSWLQDVDDKWEKIKEAMVLRHHNEAESLHAVQKMDWEWKQKELGLVEPSAKPHIDEQHVPMVQVTDFDLLQPNTC